MTHKITLTNASSMLLLSILASEGWASSIPDIVQAGSLLSETFASFAPKKDDRGVIDQAWLWEQQEWEMTEKQRECCKRAIQSQAANKKVPTGKPSYELAKSFGLE
jgi:hypothetical protein